MSKRTAFLLLYGLVAGLILSAMRAPAGLDLTQVPAAEGTTAAFFRAGALFAAALFLDPIRPLFRRGAPVATLLAAGLVGYLGHGLFLASAFEPASRMGFTLLLLVGTVVLFFLTGAGGRVDGEAEEEPHAPVPLPERLPLVLLGAGAAVALENLARHLRLFGMGLPEDDTVLGGVFLLTLLVGAVAFGRPLARPGWKRVLIAGGMLLGVGATLVGLDHLGSISGQDGLFRTLQRPFGLDFSRIGMLAPTALIAAAAFAIPGFLFGAALAGGSHPRRLSSLLIGGAVGTVLVPFAIDLRARTMTFAEAGTSAWSFELIFAGIVLAGIGALVLAWRVPAGRARFVALALAVLGIAGPFFFDRPSVWTLSPWWPSPIEPLLVRPLPEGLLTVEFAPGGAPIVTLDRRRLSPLPHEEAMDADLLRWSLSLLPAERRAGEGARVLFVGQMTPARAAVFATLAPLRLERTAPWFAALRDVEDLLFDGQLPPAGGAIPPAEARRRIRDEAYDLVLVAPVGGPRLPFNSAQVIEWGIAPAPVTAGWDLPEKTLAVVWLDGASTLAHRDLGDEVILAVGPALEELAVGVLVGEPVGDAAADRPALLDPGNPRSRASALSLLRTRSDDRRRRTMTALTTRFAAGGSGLAKCLQIHHEAQTRSSPYETRAQQIEIDRAELEALFAAAGRALEEGGPPLDATSRRVWEAEAWILTEKRLAQDLTLFVDQVARRFGPWPLLDRAAARGWEELLAPEEACFFYDRLVKARPHDIELLVDAAICYGRAGRHADAVRHLRHTLKLQGPTVDEQYDAADIADRNRRRLLGMNLVRLGDPEGRRILEELLERNPHDEELLPFVTEGPLPDLPAGFDPPGGLDDHRP